MSIHNRIVVEAMPKGHFEEGIVSGTPKPGTMMQVQSGTEPIGGKYTWEVFNGAADGEQTLVMILRANEARGADKDEAYVDGEQCFMYAPLPGEFMQVLLENQSGTADSFVISNKLMVDDGTGKFLITTGAVESEPFIIMETVAAITADTLALVQCTGH